MIAEKGKKRSFNGMSYHEAQRANSSRRNQLRKEDQGWLKKNNFKNIGWDNVINLYNKIEEFFEQYRLEDLSLGDLFLEADRIGNKYLTREEIEISNQQLAKEINEIEEEIDRQFPDTEIEVTDFSRKAIHKSREQSRRAKR
jgi:hypothetical protein